MSHKHTIINPADLFQPDTKIRVRKDQNRPKKSGIIRSFQITDRNLFKTVKTAHHEILIITIKAKTDFLFDFPITQFNSSHVFRVSNTPVFFCLIHP